MSSLGYVVLLRSLCICAIDGALLLPSLRARFATHHLVAGGSIVFALSAIALAYVHSFLFLSIALVMAGIAWISVLASLNVAAQTATPAWVRARVLAVYLLVFTGGLAGGSALWGFVAERFGI